MKAVLNGDRLGEMKMVNDKRRHQEGRERSHQEKKKEMIHD